MGWRTKFVFLLIVYAAGFATAVYCLAPTPDQKVQPPRQLAGTSNAVQHVWESAQVGSTLKSQELIKSFNSGMHKCIGFSKEAVAEAAKLLQTKIDEAAKSQSQK